MAYLNTSATYIQTIISMRGAPLEMTVACRRYQLKYSLVNIDYTNFDYWRNLALEKMKTKYPELDVEDLEKAFKYIFRE